MLLPITSDRDLCLRFILKFNFINFIILPLHRCIVGHCSFFCQNFMWCTMTIGSCWGVQSHSEMLWKIGVRVRINKLWFRKYDEFFIFHDTVFLTYPRNLDTKEGFCFLNQGTKTKFFLAVKVKNNFNVMGISFLLKQLCCCYLNIRFFSLILIEGSFLKFISVISSFSFCTLIYWGLFYNYWPLI